VSTFATLRHVSLILAGRFDYTGFSDTSRASIQMTHSANGPTVSLEEAQRIEKETADHLLKSRKLSLIVDLDQTIVHATVDPTVGEWIAEGELWEARQKKDESVKEDDKNGPNLERSGSDDEDVVNPNWEALKDVKKFRLGPEAFGAPQQGSPNMKGKARAIENDGCLYYVKPRYVFICQSFIYSNVIGCQDLVGTSFCETSLPSTRCMFIQWELVLMQRKSVLQLTRMGKYSLVES
jgi:hypothetical protein